MNSSRILRLLSLMTRAQTKLRGAFRPEPSMIEHRDRFYREIWMEAARQLGAEVKDLGDGLLDIRLEQKRIKVRQSYSALDDPVTLMLAGNKLLVHRMLAEAQLPTPRHVGFSMETFSEAAAFLKLVGRPCVVKPAKNTGSGCGVTTGIRKWSELVKATLAASAYGRELLIEEQIEGDNYRLLYLDGRLIDAVLRRPPAVIGDGRRTVADLLERANEMRLASGYKLAQYLMSADNDMKHTLGRQGLTFRSVPAEGRRVVLKRVINDNAGHENESALHLLCEPVIEAGARAVETIGARLAGVDIITSDPAYPLEETGGCVLEVNTTPGFYMHYQKRDGAFPVALVVLSALLLGARETGRLSPARMPEESSSPQNFPLELAAGGAR